MSVLAPAPTPPRLARRLLRLGFVAVALGFGGWAAGLFVFFSPLRRMRDVPAN